MAKGQQLKREIQSKILELFPGSFLYNDDKELRICGTEDGEQIQIKVTLTCAKENAPSGTPIRLESATPSAPTDMEKANVSALLKSLGL